MPTESHVSAAQMNLGQRSAVWYVNFLRGCWLIVSVLSALVLLLKIVVAFFQVNDTRDAVFFSVEVIFIAMMIYLLFVAEGMILVAAQIKPHDRKKIQEYIKNNSISDSLRLNSVIDSVQRQYKNFVVGRQAIVILIVVGLVFVVGALNKGESAGAISELERVHKGFSSCILSFLNADAVIFLISTMLPYWICQLLPHLLAEERSLQFAKLWLAKEITDLSIMISGFEAGWPSFLILDRIQQKAFRSLEEISVGDAAIFKATAAYYGYSISKRIVNIVCNESETIIEDKSICEFKAGKNSDITHSVVVPSQAEVRVIGWEYAYPNDLKKAEPITSVVWVSMTVFGEEAAVSEEEAPAPTEEEVNDDLSEEFLLTTIIPLREPIPRKGFQKEVVEITVRYALPALSTEIFADDAFCFEIGKPTECLLISVSEAPGTFIREPELETQPAEELPLFTRARTLDQERAPRDGTDNGWNIAIHYPPVGERVILTLDARPAS